MASRRRRLGTALHQLATDLARERRRTAELERELARLRPDRARSSVTGDDDTEIACERRLMDKQRVEAATQMYVYGYPLVYCLKEVGGFAEGHSSLPLSSPWNRFGSARELLGPETTFVSPNNDTLYVLAALDLRSGPQVLHVPDTADRYYVLQFVDAWTNNFAYIGRRATGTSERRFLLAGPNDSTAAPEGMEVVRAPTDVAMIVGRVQVNGAADAPAVHAIEDQFTLTPLNEGPAEGAPIPEPDPAVPEALEWWDRFRVELAAFPPPAADAPLLAIAETLGLTASESPYVDADPELAEALVAGAKAGQEMIETLAKGGTPAASGWASALHSFDYNTDSFGVGTIDAPEWRIDDRATAYATRAAAARGGLFGNHGYEANYEMVWVDADGEQLNGSRRYELRLEATPPVEAFWSLTMYSVPKFVLVANPIDRYSIGDRTPGLQFAEDGSLTIYLQRESPGADKESNWLPTPEGDFRPIMRMYQPEPEVLAGDYALPAIQRVG